jgi:3-hydroxyacyl-CoA dehydrogenase/enoyl-CoA hydratase/3-hydroxybutyryl-CoA epimerase
MDTVEHRHWQAERDADGIVWLTLDQAGSAVNTLAVDVVAELNVHLAALEQDPPRGLVLRSGKASGFIAGADIKEFLRAGTREQAEELIRGCHRVFDRLESLPCPTLSLIRGYCLGGGLELALATRYRLALDDPRTRLGLPEVRLGIHPGFGGTVRAPRLIGHLPALDLMLSGRSLSAHAAQKIGLVDYALPERQLLRAARALVLDVPPVHRPAWWQRLAGQRVVRPAVARVLRRKVAQRAPEAHYPAPYALIDLWLRHADAPRRMLAEEAASVARLVVGDTAQNLIRVFFLQEKLKARGRATATPGSKLGSTSGSTSESTARRVHVIGAGIMGGDIAAWCALRGLQVTLQDQSAQRIAPAIKRAAALFRKELKQPRLVQAALDRLMPDIHATGVDRADVVIEAIFENAEAKQALYREIEPRLQPGAVLATNTSSLPLEVLSRALARPERLVGLHFFNPVAKMQLVEIVYTPMTDAGMIAAAAAFTRRIDRLPLPVRSSPGFLVNRVLMPYLLEAVTAVSEGVPPELVDKAALDFGMPMGPIELADTVGLDICLSVAGILSNSMRLAVPERLHRMVEAGQLGRKSGRGFYTYQKGERVRGRPDKTAAAPADLADRLILSLLNEAVACRRAGVVEDDDALDAGIVFGTGFAPFRGGPMHYIRASGVANLKDRLEKLALAHGERFRSDAGWMEL